MDKNSQIITIRKDTAMKLIGNIIWFLFGGFESAIALCVTGLVYCITIIGIPFGKQAFKMAKLMISPFGKTVNTNFGKHPIMNIIWIIFGGLEACIGFFILGLLYCITIIGIPFGKQWFKMGKLILCPFGATVDSASAATETSAETVEA